jgi:hypothetical protein
MERMGRTVPEGSEEIARDWDPGLVSLVRAFSV